MQLITFIAEQIKKAKNTGGVDIGRVKYSAYFVTTKLYNAYKSDVDSILTLDGYADCIVTQG